VTGSGNGTAWLTHNIESLVCLLHGDSGSVTGTVWLTQNVKSSSVPCAL
jgi:hypothetical protein